MNTTITDTTRTPAVTMTPGTATSIRLVAEREIKTRVKTRSFLISTAVLLLIIVIGLIVWRAFSGGGTDIERVGLTGDPALSSVLEQYGKAGGTPISVVQVTGEPAARSQVESGDLDAAVVRGAGNTYTLISKKPMSSALAGIMRGSIEQRTLSAGLSARGVDAATLPTASITMVAATPDKPDDGQRIVVALVGAILLIMAIMLGGNMIAVGVVEEKTSRIVELLLACVKPLHLMWGKILGIGVVALGQILLLGVAALITGVATGLLTIASTAVWMFLATIGWFILGFLFFATLYAAAGALVTRQEELGSAIMPLTVLSMAVMYSGVFGIQALDSTFIRVLTWIPPFSAVLIPIRIATGNTNALQIIATFALMVVACAAATWIAAQIYERSILRTGTRVKWTEALSMARSA